MDGATCPPANNPRPLLPLSAVVPLGGIKCAVVFTFTIPSTSVPLLPSLLVILSAFIFAVLSSPTRRYPDPPEAVSYTHLTLPTTPYV